VNLTDWQGRYFQEKARREALEAELRRVHEECADMVRVAATPGERAIAEGCANRVGTSARAAIQRSDAIPYTNVEGF
jgi:hypothetical protein